MSKALNPSFKKLTSIQVVALSDAFRKHITITDEGSLYENGYITAVVASYRKTLGFGSLYSKNQKHTDRLDKLELRVLELERTISKLLANANNANPSPVNSTNSLWRSIK